MNVPSRPDALREVPRRWFVRAAVALLVVGLVAPAGISGATYLATTDDPTNLRASVDEPANGTTVISIQGFHFKGMANPDKPARLVAVGPRGDVKWVHDGTGFDAQWFYDVDPLDDGNLLVTATARGQTLVYELDPETQERVWTERLDIRDTHDVDLVNNGTELLVANMRNYDEGTGENDDRIFVYDRATDEVVWEFHFRRIYDRSAGGPYEGDWTHVNDVDRVGEGRYLASPRNMDEVVVVNRSTKDVEMRLGRDGNHSVLYEQHNPQYLVGENGTPTMLVADSENDRIVEYARTGADGANATSAADGSAWTRTWSVGTRGFNWPRDADRLPSGNTLVVDTMHHRVVEVTPTGEVVWAFHAPWAPYDVERIAHGDEPGGPTMRELNATGSYDLGGSGLTVSGGDTKTVSFWLVETFEGTPVAAEADELARLWAHVTPWIRPVWMTSWEFLAVVCGGLVLAAWGLGEAVYQRRRIRRGLSGLLSRIRRPVE